jgi:hypothetical protein
MCVKETVKVMKNIAAVLSVLKGGVVLAQNALALPSGSLDGGKRGGYYTYSDGDGLNSNYAPTNGNFTVAAEGDTPVPVSEPGTMVLFGVVSDLYAAKRGRKRQAV